MRSAEGAVACVGGSERGFSGDEKGLCVGGGSRRILLGGEYGDFSRCAFTGLLDSLRCARMVGPHMYDVHLRDELEIDYGVSDAMDELRTRRLSRRSREDCQ